MKNILITLSPIAVVLIFGIFLSIRNFILSRRESKLFWKAVDNRMKEVDLKYSKIYREAFNNPIFIENMKQCIKRQEERKKWMRNYLDETERKMNESSFNPKNNIN